jgi:hypothetical protein
VGGDVVVATASSKAGVEEGGGDLSTAGTSHEAIIDFTTIVDAFFELWKSVDHGTTDTGRDNDILKWVLIVSNLGKLRCNLSDITESVALVGGLG